MSHNKNKKMNKLKRLQVYLCLIILIMSAYVFIEPYFIEDKVISIVDDDIPQQFSNTKIVFISDIHHGPFFSISRVKKLVSRINNKNPDIVLLGGDYVHRSLKYIEPCFNELKSLKAPLGVYGVLGNHDHWESAELTKKNMQNSGIIQLDNKAFWVYKNRERLKIGGVGDYFEDKQDIATTINDVGINDFVILVFHNPDYVEELNTDKVDLVLQVIPMAGRSLF